jgi:oxaloacetate decarboxylase gamma subunit
MPVSHLLLEGLRLMVIGMGIVFTFLLLLVGVLRLLSLTVQRFAPEPAPLASPDVGAASLGLAVAPAEALAGGELVAVITAAIARYRRDHPRA